MIISFSGAWCNNVKNSFMLGCSLSYRLSGINHTICVVSEKPQPFDFLIDGELLRTSIEQFLLTKGITAVSSKTLLRLLRCSSHRTGLEVFVIICVDATQD